MGKEVDLRFELSSARRLYHEPVEPPTAEHPIDYIPVTLQVDWRPVCSTKPRGWGPSPTIAMAGLLAYPLNLERSFGARVHSIPQHLLWQGKERSITYVNEVPTPLGCISASPELHRPPHLDIVKYWISYLNRFFLCSPTHHPSRTNRFIR